MPVNIEIDDFDRVSARLKGALQQVIYETAEDMAKLAIGFCPVSAIDEPGYTHLFETIRVRGVNQYAADVLAGDNTRDVEYAAYVEFGTHKMSAQPYMRPAAAAARIIMQERIARLDR